MNELILCVTPSYSTSGLFSDLLVPTNSCAVCHKSIYKHGIQPLVSVADSPVPELPV